MTRKGVTAIQLVDLWYKAAKKKTTTAAKGSCWPKKLTKDQATHVVTKMIMDGLLKEKFRHTAYACNSYVVVGSVSVSAYLSRNNQRYLVRVPLSFDEMLRRLKNGEKMQQHQHQKNRKATVSWKGKQKKTKTHNPQRRFSLSSSDDDKLEIKEVKEVQEEEEEQQQQQQYQHRSS